MTLSLTKIFSGMELGPEAIDANFGQLVAEATVKKGSFDCLAPFTGFGNGGTTGVIQYSRVGAVVYVHGSITPTKLLPVGTNYVFANLPDEIKTNGNNYAVQQGSSNSKWLLTIEDNKMKADRYGTGTNIDLPVGLWMPFNTTYIIEQGEFEVSKPIYTVAEGQPMTDPRWEADDYVLAAGETDKVPRSGQDGLYNPIWQNGDWVGSTKPPVTPTEEQQQLAELIKSNAQQTSLNAQLIKQVAALQAASAAKTDTTQEAE